MCFAYGVRKLLWRMTSVKYLRHSAAMETKNKLSESLRDICVILNHIALGA